MDEQNYLDMPDEEIANSSFPATPEEVPAVTEEAQEDTTVEPVAEEVAVPAEEPAAETPPPAAAETAPEPAEPTEPDYKAEVAKILTPFRANGKEIKVERKWRH